VDPPGPFLAPLLDRRRQGQLARIAADLERPRVPVHDQAADARHPGLLVGRVLSVQDDPGLARLPGFGRSGPLVVEGEPVVLEGQPADQGTGPGRAGLDGSCGPAKALVRVLDIPGADEGVAGPLEEVPGGQLRAGQVDGILVAPVWARRGGRVLGGGRGVRVRFRGSRGLWLGNHDHHGRMGGARVLDADRHEDGGQNGREDGGDDLADPGHRRTRRLVGGGLCHGALSARAGPAREGSGPFPTQSRPANTLDKHLPSECTRLSATVRARPGR
jgi:hypothetical protein